MTDLCDLIRFYDGVLPPALCKRIVALFESAPEHHIGPRGRPLGQRDSEHHFNWVQMNTSDRPGFAEIDDEIAPRGEPACRALCRRHRLWAVSPWLRGVSHQALSAGAAGSVSAA